MTTDGKRGRARLVTLALLALVLMPAVACDTGASSTATPTAIPASVPTPTPDGFILTLRAEPVDGKPLKMRFVAEIAGGPDNAQELYCGCTFWDFGDDYGVGVCPQCIPWTSDVKIRRTFERTHTYAEPSTYEVTFSRKSLEATLIVEIP